VNVLSLQDERIYYEFKAIYEKGRNQKMIEFKATNPRNIEALNIDVTNLYEKIEVFAFQSLSKLNFFSYEEARRFIIEKHPNIKSSIEYRNAYINKELSPNLPAFPNVYYEAKGWTSWYEFFDKKGFMRRGKDFWSYTETKNWIQKNLVPIGVNSKKKFQDCKRGIYPNAPEIPFQIPYYLGYYKDELDYKDLFDKKEIIYEVLRRYLSMYFPEIVSSNMFYDTNKAGKFNKRITGNVVEFYKGKSSWKGWDDFLKKIRNDQYKLFKEIVHKHIIKTYNYTESPEKFYKNLPKNKRYGGYILPHKLREFFGDEFEGYHELFGVAVKLSYEEAKTYIKNMNLKTYSDFIKYNKNEFPFNFPKDPYSAFKAKGEWISWEDFLGADKG
jgi:hypothetical protein